MDPPHAKPEKSLKNHLPKASLVCEHRAQYLPGLAQSHVEGGREEVDVSGFMRQDARRTVKVLVVLLWIPKSGRASCWWREGEPGEPRAVTGPLGIHFLLSPEPFFYLTYQGRFATVQHCFRIWEYYVQDKQGLCLLNKKRE